MQFLLKDPHTGEYFCTPFGDDNREWSLNPDKAHRFMTSERAYGGATIWWHLHNRALEVVPYYLEEHGPDRL